MANLGRCPLQACDPRQRKRPGPVAGKRGGGEEMNPCQARSAPKKMDKATANQ